jgi:hypothetical protein
MSWRKNNKAQLKICEDGLPYSIYGCLGEQIADSEEFSGKRFEFDVSPAQRQKSALINHLLDCVRWHQDPESKNISGECHYRTNVPNKI